jgi:hypothetical protein
MKNQPPTTIYKQIELDHYVETQQDKDSYQTILHKTEYEISSLDIIERFVDKVGKTSNLALSQKALKDSLLKVENSSLWGFYAYMNACTSAHSIGHVFSPKIELFFKCCKKLNISLDWSSFGNPLEKHVDHQQINYGTLFNTLISSIRHELTGSQFKNKQRSFAYNERRRTGRVLSWENNLFNWRSRQLIISLTLSYKPEYREKVTIGKIQNDLGKLLNNRRHNSLLSNIKAYTWKIEDAVSTGLHVHIVIAYSSESCRDIQIAQSIGEYWQSIVTDGMGQYNNENKHRGNYWLPGEGRATGQINYNDEKRREGLRTLLKYLAKADQHLKQKNSAKTRTFQMSRIPEHSSLGRRRQWLQEMQSQLLTGKQETLTEENDRILRTE